MEKDISAITALSVSTALFTELTAIIVDTGLMSRGEIANRLAYAGSQQQDEGAKQIISGIAYHLRHNERNEE